MIKQIKKRSGSVVPFDAKKITEAIWKAAEAVDVSNKAVKKNKMILFIRIFTTF